MEATKRPWAVHGTQIVREGEGFEYELASTSNSPISREEATANARLIVQAVNLFDDLVEALRDSIENCETCRVRLHPKRRCARCQNFMALLKKAQEE